MEKAFENKAMVTAKTKKRMFFVDKKVAVDVEIDDTTNQTAKLTAKSKAEAKAKKDVK